MKKIFVLLTSIMLLAGCAETMALLGPASSLLGGGNVVQSSISSAASYGIKKTTGKSPMQHALAYAEEKNPNKNKDKCLSFLKETDSEACYIAKKQISSVKKSASKKIKNIINQSKPKKVIVRKNKSKIEKVKKNKIETVKKIKSKIVTVKKIKTEQEPQLRSAKSMLIQSATSKKQVAHLKVSIKKNYKNNNLSK
tara:strand:+ start:232 stop:819 length:588 start_codon:yes stop_codon:yes gene_type:complete